MNKYIQTADIIVYSEEIPIYTISCLYTFLLGLITRVVQVRLVDQLARFLFETLSGTFSDVLTPTTRVVLKYCIKSERNASILLLPLKALIGNRRQFICGISCVVVYVYHGSV